MLKLGCRRKREINQVNKKGLEHDARNGIHTQRHRGVRERSRCEDLQIIQKLWNVKRPVLK